MTLAGRMGARDTPAAHLSNVGIRTNRYALSVATEAAPQRTGAPVASPEVTIVIPGGAQTGGAFSIDQSNGRGAQRADYVGGSPYSQAGDRFQYLNPKAFVIPATGTFGNVARNSVRGVGTWDFDTALSRVFRLRESQRFEVRAEAFNVLNETNYAFATSNISSGLAGFGIVNAQETFPARILQLAGKIIF